MIGESSHPGRGGWALYWTLFAGFALLYAFTAQTTVAWQDSGIFQWRIVHFDPRGELGLALAHPLLIVVGKALSWLPLGTPAWRINLASALPGAMAAANVALLVRWLAPANRWAPWLAGGTFGLAHTVWWLAAIAESQCLHAALFTAGLLAAVALLRSPGWVTALLLGLLSGLALTAHDLALLALPAWGLLVLTLCLRRKLAWGGLAAFIVGWAIGATALLALVIEMAQKAGAIAAVKSALFGDRWGADVLGGSGRAIALGSGYILYNFPNLALPLAGVGLFKAWRKGPQKAAAAVGGAGPPRAAAWMLTYLLAVYLLFAIRYTVADQFMFFLPLYAMVAIFAGLGLAHLAKAGSRRWLCPLAAAMLLATVAFYAAAPAVWTEAKLPLPGRKDLPFRDAARYWLTPWKQDENSADEFARAALAHLPEGSLVIADTTSFVPLRWVQSEVGSSATIWVGARPGSLAPGRPDVFVVSQAPNYHPEWLDGMACYEPFVGGVLYRVVWKPSSTRE